MLHGGNGNFAIRQGDWVLIDAASGDGNGGKKRPGEPDWFKQERGYAKNEFPGELYNLKDDLAQRRNLYGEKTRGGPPSQGAARKIQGGGPQHAQPANQERTGVGMRLPINRREHRSPVRRADPLHRSAQMVPKPG